VVSHHVMMTMNDVAQSALLKLNAAFKIMACFQNCCKLAR
jgi:hypothetical protein